MFSRPFFSYVTVRHIQQQHFSTHFYIFQYFLGEDEVLLSYIVVSTGRQVRMS